MSIVRFKPVLASYGKLCALPQKSEIHTPDSEKGSLIIVGFCG